MNRRTFPKGGVAHLFLEISGVLYSLRRLEGAEGGVVGGVVWRLTKLAEHVGGGAYTTEEERKVYHVHRDEFGLHCTCGDFVFRRENTGEACKHCLALMAVGLVARE